MFYISHLTNWVVELNEIYVAPIVSLRSIKNVKTISDCQKLEAELIWKCYLFQFQLFFQWWRCHLIRFSEMTHSRCKKVLSLLCRCPSWTSWTCRWSYQTSLQFTWRRTKTSCSGNEHWLILFRIEHMNKSCLALDWLYNLYTEQWYSVLSSISRKYANVLIWRAGSLGSMWTINITKSCWNRPYISIDMYHNRF